MATEIEESLSTGGNDDGKRQTRISHRQIREAHTFCRTSDAPQVQAYIRRHSVAWWRTDPAGRTISWRHGGNRKEALLEILQGGTGTSSHFACECVQAIRRSDSRQTKGQASGGQVVSNSL